MISRERKAVKKRLMKAIEPDVIAIGWMVHQCHRVLEEGKP